jgi:hypothetical protein
MWKMITLSAIGLVMFSASASACFYAGEKTSGTNKICIYQCGSGTKTTTISIASVCPTSINYTPKPDDKADEQQLADASADK